MLNFKAIGPGGLLPPPLKKRLKKYIFACKAKLVRFGWSYSPGELQRKFVDLGIRQGDCIMMHVGFDELNGFLGGPVDLIDCVLDAIGPEGHLLMMSMPYTSSSRAYLMEGQPFNTRRTPSHMGLVTEVFRRRRGVLRSENPLHPVLAFGPRAEWLTEGHADLPYSCGRGSPFEKMLQLNAKALFFGVGEGTLTFAHYLEDHWKDSAPVAVYPPQPIESRIVDRSGAPRTVNLYPFSAEAVAKRDFASLFAALEDAGRLRRDRIGNTVLNWLSLRDLFDTARHRVAAGRHIHDPTAQAPRIYRYRGNLLRRSFTGLLEEIRSGRLAADAARIGRRIWSGSRGHRTNL